MHNAPIMQAQSYIVSLPFYPKKDLYSFFVGANVEAVELLSQLLCLDPHRRPSAAEALTHPYFKKYHVKEDEVCRSTLPSSDHRCTLYYSRCVSRTMTTRLSSCSWMLKGGEVRVEHFALS